MLPNSYDRPVTKRLPTVNRKIGIVSNRRPVHRIHQMWVRSFDDVLCSYCVHRYYCIHVEQTILLFEAFHWLDHEKENERENCFKFIVTEWVCLRSMRKNTHFVSPLDWILILQKVHGAFRPARYYIELWHAIHTMPRYVKTEEKKKQWKRLKWLRIRS